MMHAERPRGLFICGSPNQTTQLHAVARELPDFDVWFSPYYVDPGMDMLRRLGLLEGTIGGDRLGGRCLEYLKRNGLRVDQRGQGGGYDFVVTCSDVVIPRNIRKYPIVAVQEGILDPDGFMWRLVRRFPNRLPRWLAGTAATGLSGAYEKFCVASQGYKDLFVRRGARAERIVVTGIPNFDDCEAFHQNEIRRSGYVLICTSDTRETLKWDSRPRFLAWAREIASGRPTLIRLHPNERRDRAQREIEQWFPEAELVSEGRTEELIANCSVLITQFSSTVFVGLALGKEVHSYHPIETLRPLVPEQNRSAAAKIAEVCRQVVFGTDQPRGLGGAEREQAA